ncbi:MAG: cupin [SAR86 cluster bacterium]|uniref:Cupin n=1 Tax=SAR86 cluster bacterium TaxID=2030880 RepID=A0A2A4X0E2_9GAMM|nr:MAG: cupin [SAR86 cluster bacterium]
MSKRQLNAAFDSEEFLTQYWQKKPVLLSNFIPDFSDSLAPEELAGLACEEPVESRLVTEPEPGKWQLRHGPFEDSDFTQLPESNWTLLVQAVDHWVEDVADIKTLFNFLPSWRIDDIMISFAAQGGSVGPHYDYYDVFLLQGQGQRNWQIGDRCDSNTELVQGEELSLLQNFEATMEFNLTAGDALYIPPRFAHWGRATSDSLCYSIGFRAPSMAEMIEGFSDFIIKDQDPAQRYEDSDAQTELRSAEIKPELLDASYRQLTERLAQKQKFAGWFGCYVSQPKYPELIQPLDEELSPEGFAALLSDGVQLAKNPSSRFAFIESADKNCVLLFVDGAMVSFPMKQLSNIVAFCEVPGIVPGTSSHLLGDPEIAELLRQLLNQGSLLVSA